MGSSSSSRPAEDWSAYQAWRGPRDGTWRTAEDELNLLLRLRKVRGGPRDEPPVPERAEQPRATSIEPSALASQAGPSVAWYLELLAGLALDVAGIGLLVIGSASAVASGAWIAWALAVCGFALALSGTWLLWQRCAPRAPRPAGGKSAGPRQPTSRRPRRPTRV